MLRAIDVRFFRNFPLESGNGILTTAMCCGIVYDMEIDLFHKDASDDLGVYDNCDVGNG